MTQKKRLRDHPRLRGEQPTTWTQTMQTQGSPPLARGTANRREMAKPQRRITPACAGNRRRYKRCINSGRDHPRLRGEQADYTPVLPRRGGSPPLARGTVRHWQQGTQPRRITPACAGNSKPRCSYTLRLGDHPRLRGEQLYRIDDAVGCRGSPPLARGTVTAKLSSSV